MILCRFRSIPSQGRGDATRPRSRDCWPVTRQEESLEEATHAKRSGAHTVAACHIIHSHYVITQCNIISPRLQASHHSQRSVFTSLLLFFYVLVLHVFVCWSLTEPSLESNSLRSQTQFLIRCLLIT